MIKSTLIVSKGVAVSTNLSTSSIFKALLLAIKAINETTLYDCRLLVYGHYHYYYYWLSNDLGRNVNISFSTHNC